MGLHRKITFPRQCPQPGHQPVRTAGRKARGEDGTYLRGEHAALLQPAQRLPLGVLRILLKVLPAVLPRFYQDYPYVDIQIWEVGSNNTDKLLLDGTVDLACLTTVPKHDQINYILVEKEEMILLASSQTELAKRIPGGTPISILEAKNEKFVSNKPGHSVRSIQDSLFITNNIRPRILIETSNIDIEKRVAIACGAVTICPLNYIEDSDGIGEKAFIYPLLDTGNTRNCYICHRKDLYLTKYMCDFIRLVQETSRMDCS